MLRRMIGVQKMVLVEGPGARRGSIEPAWTGRDEAGFVVNFAAPDESGLVGRIIPVRVTQAKKHSLWGEALP